MNNIIELRDIEYTYPNGTVALRGVNLEIGRGEKIALVGSNGAGKSTLLLMFNGMLKPDTGEVIFDGRPVSYGRKALRQLRKKVGFVFQNPDHQIIAPTVYQDVAFGPVNLDLNEEDTKEAVKKALMYVGLSNFERRPPHQLSGGEKKKVAIAGVLAMDPEVLVFDEPTSALDPASSESIMELLDELNLEGKTVVISTHDVELAYPWADRIILMNAGEVLVSKKPGKAFSDRRLMDEARLSKPVLLELYDSLVDLNMADVGEAPKSVLDFVRIFERRSGARCESTGCGSIYLADADITEINALTGFIDSGTIGFVGAMGSSAKKIAGTNGITLSFTYGVIDKCLLKAISGRNSLIITTGGMVKRVFDRVDEFVAESGKKVEVIPFEDREKTTGD